MEILFADRDIAVCVKPVGLDSEQSVPQALSESLPGAFYPVHRLDLNVGGVMVYARNSAAAAALSQQIVQGSFVKEYVAQVHGIPPEKDDWTDLLFKDSRKNKVFVVKKERSGVKAARLEFVRLCAGEESQVRIRLHTGRSHQIRVQFSSRGFPLVGDHKYGSRSVKTEPLLFSCCLRFTHKGKPVSFEVLPSWLRTDPSDGEVAL